MRFVKSILLPILLLAVALPAAAAPAKETGLPPLLDRELFFGDPEISGAQISPDGKFIAFVKPLDGTRNVWVKKTDEPFDAARPLTNDQERPIPGYFWSQDGKYILFVQDKGGDENYNIYAVDPSAKPAEGAVAPEARALTGMEGVRATIYSVPESDPDLIFIGLNDRDPAWHDLYRVKISTGERTLLRENTDRIAGWSFDLEGNLRLAVRTLDNGDTEILRVNDEGMTPVYTCDVFETCAPIRFHKDGKRVYMITNKGDDVDLTRLMLFDPATGDETLVETDPEGRVDFGGAVFSNVTDELIATTYVDERTRIYWRDKKFKKDYDRIAKQLPGKDISPGSRTDDEQIWLIAAGSDTEPGERYLYDRKTKKLTFQYRVFEDLPREYLAPMKAIRYPSSDGLEIPAFLTLPKGVAPEKLPLVVYPHGGPWARDAWGYEPIAQFLANRGYAVLQPNFRASTGYGKAFLNAGNNEWGQKMQDDLTWGVKYLVSEGIADPERVGIMGGSYGGYATLAGVAFTPDVYAAGVSIVGPSSLLTLLESIPPYWESARKIFHARMGDPTTEAGKAQLERQSPLFSADKIKTPLLVVQGANDPRVKKAESDQIVVALRERDFPVEYIVAPDEGHGFAHPVNNLAMFASAEKFLANHLGGRYQETMTDEVAGKLADITVDPSTVTLAAKVDASQVGMPKPEASLTAGLRKYNVQLSAGHQAMTMTLVREIRAREDGDWQIVETLTGAMDGREETVLQHDTLEVKSRSGAQSGASVDLTYEGSQVDGTLDVQGQKMPVEVDLGGPAFADGAGRHAVLATLPLEKGYTATFRNLDLMRGKGSIYRVTVEGKDKVRVPAGSFDAVRLEVASAEGDPESFTIWVDPATRAVVRTSAVLPQMGGALLTTELVE